MNASPPRQPPLQRCASNQAQAAVHRLQASFAGSFSLAAIRKNENEAADGFVRRLYAMLPWLRITELFAEVDGWTAFADRRPCARPTDRAES